jgi:hypothetical protein
MLRLSCFSLAVVSLVGCRSDPDRDRTPSPPQPSSPTAQPGPDLGAMPLRPIAYPAPTDLEQHKRDRAGDPSFALVKLAESTFRGRRSDSCPTGTTVVKAEGWTLEKGVMSIRLPGGGCPTWAGYTLVAKKLEDLSYGSRERLPANTLPFYLCADRWHDVCESMREYTWVFDLSDTMEASKATSIVFAPPTPIDPDPASLCCCVAGDKSDVTAWATCEARGGVCDVEAECYGIEGPIP